MRGFWLTFRSEDSVNIYHVHFRQIDGSVRAYAMKTSDAGYAYSEVFDSYDAAERGVVLHLQDAHPGTIPTRVLFLSDV
jgi:hypothetical protein